MRGDAGSNYLRGGQGADVLDGGGGSDTADYINAPAVNAGTGLGLTIDLLTPANNTGDAAGDSYFSIENLRGSNFNDTLRGNGSGNFLNGGAGADILDGRGGIDYANYATAGGPITASLADQTINTGEAAGDTYTSIEGLYGSNFDDTLIGDGGDNFLRGNAGGDTLQGGGAATRRSI